MPKPVGSPFPFYTIVVTLFRCHSGCIDGRSAAIDPNGSEQKAYLFRTNFNLFNCAVQLIIERGLKDVGFVGVGATHAMPSAGISAEIF